MATAPARWATTSPRSTSAPVAPPRDHRRRRPHVCAARRRHRQVLGEQRRRAARPGRHQQPRRRPRRDGRQPRPDRPRHRAHRDRDHRRRPPHVCAARRRHGQVLGWNGFGQLGHGDTTDRGDVAGEMGDNLPAIDLGTRPAAGSVTRLSTRSAPSTPVRGSSSTAEAFGSATPVPSGTSIEIPVTALAQVPDDSFAVVVNLTTTRSVEAGYLTIHPCDAAGPRGIEPQLPVWPRHGQLGHRAGQHERNDLCIHLRDDRSDRRYHRLHHNDRVPAHHPYPARRHPSSSPQAAGTTLRIPLPHSGGTPVTVTATRASADGYLHRRTTAQAHVPIPASSTTHPVSTPPTSPSPPEPSCASTRSADVDIIVDHHGSISGGVRARTTIGRHPHWCATRAWRDSQDSRHCRRQHPPRSTSPQPNRGPPDSSRCRTAAQQPRRPATSTSHPDTTSPTSPIIPTTQATCITTSTTTHLIIDLAATIN